MGIRRQYPRPKKIVGPVNGCLDSVLEYRKAGSLLKSKISMPVFDENISVVQLAADLNRLSEKLSLPFTAVDKETPKPNVFLADISEDMDGGSDVIVKLFGTRGCSSAKVLWGVVQLADAKDGNAEIGFPRQDVKDFLKPVDFSWRTMKNCFTTLGTGYLVLHQ